MLKIPHLIRKLWASFAATAAIYTLTVGCTAKTDVDQIFVNGDILTMTGPKASYVEALAIKDGKIVFAGTQKQAMTLKGDKTKLTDLSGRTLMPGFIDAHGHISQYAVASQMIDLQPEPYGKVMSIPELQKVLKDYIVNNKIPPGTLIIGNGYDDAIMKEHRHPTAQELDQVSSVNPIYILHASGHMGVANSLLMKNMNITYDTPNPTGGIIGKDPATRQLTGKMQENANINTLQYAVTQLPRPAESDQYKSLQAAEQAWFANGQTTICEGRSAPDNIDHIIEADKKGLLKGDYVILPDYDLNANKLAHWKQFYKKYNGHVKIGGIKMTFDGSPQGKSAWLTEPYLIPPDGEKQGFKGQPIYSREAAYKGLKAIFAQGMQVHIHCNGDAAIDEGLDLLERLKKEKKLTEDMRCVLIHSQVCRKDQVPRYKQIGVMPSWFPTHVYLWGDWHRTNVLGEKRAERISPLKEGLDQGIRFTIHHDSPVTPPDLMTAVYAAVNRKTRSGYLLGPGQRISPYEALKAITINAAWQWGEEKEKGTLEKNKRADLVILDKNPIKVNSADIKDVVVMETYKDGKQVYKK